MTILIKNPTALANVSISNDTTGIPSIDWKYNSHTLSVNAPAVTVKPLYTISGLWMEKFLSMTSQLWCTGYNFPNTNLSITDITLQLTVQRVSRIQDLLVQLTLNGELIGNNMASVINPVQSDMYTGNLQEPLNPVGDYGEYSGSLSDWGVTLTSVNVADPTFGIVLGFKSNQIYPQSDLAVLDQASLRITFG